MIEHTTGLPLDRWFDDAVAMPFGAPLLGYRPTMKFSSQLGGGEKTATRIAPTESNAWRDGVTRHEVHDENAAAMRGVAGHAGLFGTAESVLAISGAWLKAYHSTGCRLEHSLVRQWVAHQNISNSSWALGWDTPSKDSSSGQYFSEQSFGHLGYTGTSLWIDPVKRIEVVLLSNRVHLGHDNNKIRTFRPRIHDLIMQECAT